jgi:hypothetical protein
LLHFPGTFPVLKMKVTHSGNSPTPGKPSRLGTTVPWGTVGQGTQEDLCLLPELIQPQSTSNCPRAESSSLRTPPTHDLVSQHTLPQTLFFCSPSIIITLVPTEGPLSPLCCPGLSAAMERPSLFICYVRVFRCCF